MRVRQSYKPLYLGQNETRHMQDTLWLTHWRDLGNWTRPQRGDQSLIETVSAGKTVELRWMVVRERVKCCIMSFITIFKKA